MMILILIMRVMKSFGGEIKKMIQTITQTTHYVYSFFMVLCVQTTPLPLFL
jgi:hypothetical protein